MNAHIRIYTPEDFPRVRQFLSEHFYAYGPAPINSWEMSRWNWCRYHPLVFRGDIAAHIAYWENMVRVLESDQGQILAVICVDAPKPTGEAYINYCPAAEPYLAELVDCAEASFSHPQTGELRIAVADHDFPLQAILRERPYGLNNWTNHHSAQSIVGLVEPQLPPGYRVRSLAEADSRLDLVCQALGRGFNHTDPAEWSTPEQYRLVQTAPDYSPQNDLVIEAPNGLYVSHCITWYDAYNRLGIFEPVSTHAEYRRLGLGRALLQAGMNRMYQQGARTAFVGSGLEFYRRCGFKVISTSRDWIRGPAKV